MFFIQHKFYDFSLVRNHFHFVFKQVQDQGISEYIQKVCGTYSQYFNKKYRRTGTLFQGRFKYVPIYTDKKLLQLISYTNLNHRLHGVDIYADNISGDQYVQERLYLSEPFKVKNIHDLFGGKEEYMKRSQLIINDIIEQRKREKKFAHLE